MTITHFKFFFSFFIHFHFFFSKCCNWVKTALELERFVAADEAVPKRARPPGRNKPPRAEYTVLQDALQNIMGWKARTVHDDLTGTCRG